MITIYSFRCRVIIRIKTEKESCDFFPKYNKTYRNNRNELFAEPKISATMATESFKEDFRSGEN